VYGPFSVGGIGAANIGVFSSITEMILTIITAISTFIIAAVVLSIKVPPEYCYPQVTTIVPVNISAWLTLVQVISVFPLASYNAMYSPYCPGVVGMGTVHAIGLEFVFAAGVVKETLFEVVVLVPNAGPIYTSIEHEVPCGKSVLTTTLAT
jgi:hypothetical protein